MNFPLPTLPLASPSRHASDGIICPREELTFISSTSTERAGGVAVYTLVFGLFVCDVELLIGLSNPVQKEGEREGGGDRQEVEKNRGKFENVFSRSSSQAKAPPFLCTLRGVKSPILGPQMVLAVPRSKKQSRKDT